MKILMAAVALSLSLAAPVSTQAAEFRDAGSTCHVTVPAGWTLRPGRAVAPTPGFYARVRSVPDAAGMRAQITALGGAVVYDNPARLLAAAQVQGNRLYWSVSKTHPACWATVTFPAGAAEPQARAIAESLRP